MRLRATRIVEWVGLAGAANASYGRPALLEREEATIAASPLAAAPILGAPRVRVIRSLIWVGE